MAKYQLVKTCTIRIKGKVNICFFGHKHISLQGWQWDRTFISNMYWDKVDVNLHLIYKKKHGKPYALTFTPFMIHWIQYTKSGVSLLVGQY